MLKIITVLGLALLSPLTLTASGVSDHANTQLRISSIINDMMSAQDTIKNRVNLSGRQRMLTQRMTKLALLISSNINSGANKKHLIEVATLYGQTLNDFKDTDNQDIKNQILVIEEAWKPFLKNIKRIAEGQNKEGNALTYVISNNETLLKESNILVDKFEKSNTSQNYIEKAMVSIVNIAGRQRMLTQKMTKEKLLITQKGQAQYKDKLVKTIKLFDDSLALLINGNSEQKIVKPSNQKIINQLSKVSVLWKELKPLYEKNKPSSKEMTTIIEKNPILLGEMHKMVQMAELKLEY